MSWRNLALAAIMLTAASVNRAYTQETLAGIDISYWDTPRKGANCFNQSPPDDFWWEAAAEAGIEFVRLACDKWPSGDRDFLIGNADEYKGIVEEDFAIILDQLAKADAAGVKVVLVLLTLPGDRWRQNNEGQPDFRLWLDKKYAGQTAALWRDLARRLAGSRALAGYNILNEPFPERAPVEGGPWRAARETIGEWYARIQGSAADLNLFNAQVVNAIREVDAETPIILDCGLWASPSAISYMEPLTDRGVLYSFHTYDPYEYTNRKTNNGRFVYPADPSAYEDEEEKEVAASLSREGLARLLEPVARWQQAHGLPPQRIIAGEFGCDRMAGGAQKYLDDVISIIDEHGWHWAFYAFREDGWDAMDYELGTKGLGAGYWQAKERGEEPALERGNNPVWNVISERLKDSRGGRGGL